MSSLVERDYYTLSFRRVIQIIFRSVTIPWQEGAKLQPEEVIPLLKMLRGNFGNMADETVTLFKEKLLAEDGVIAKTAINKIIDGSDYTFLPRWGDVKAVIVQCQREVSAEALREKKSGCSLCNNVTWIRNGDNFAPCEVCRVATYEAWKDGVYSVDYTIAEEAGKSYPLAVRGSLETGNPVSIERTMTWIEFIAKRESLNYQVPEDISEEI